MEPADPDDAIADGRLRDLAGRLRAAGCVFAEDEAQVLVEAADDAEELERLVARRTTGEPLEQVVGWAALGGVRIHLTPGVFVPRRRTELLVREGRRLLDARAADAAPAVVVDLCCGSGAVGRAVVEGRRAKLLATDVDTVAVACAATNLAAVGGSVWRGDLYDALPRDLRGGVVLLVANAPYVPTAALATMPAEARDHEPRHALDGGPDGLDLHRRIAAEATAWLAPGGGLVIETSRAQASLTAEAAADGGLDPRIVHADELGGTVVVAVL